MTAALSGNWRLPRREPRPARPAPSAGTTRRRPRPRRRREPPPGSARASGAAPGPRRAAGPGPTAAPAAVRRRPAVRRPARASARRRSGSCDLSFELPDRLPDGPGLQLVGPVDVAVEEGLVAHGVDQAGHAGRDSGGPGGRPTARRSAARRRRPRAGGARCSARSRSGQRRQVVADRDALPELAQPLPVELLPQLRLADQDDLEELALIGLEVREQADLLEELVFQVLGLVDDQDDVVPGGRLVEQVLVQELEVRGAIQLPRRRDPAPSGSSASSGST